jgi:hypothetical protein
MTRGRRSNVALAVCDDADMDHPVAGRRARASEVVAGAMGRVASERTALEVLREELARSESLATLAPRLALRRLGQRPPGHRGRPRGGRDLTGVRRRRVVARPPGRPRRRRDQEGDPRPAPVRPDYGWPGGRPASIQRPPRRSWPWPTPSWTSEPAIRGRPPSPVRESSPPGAGDRRKSPRTVVARCCARRDAPVVRRSVSPVGRPRTAVQARRVTARRGRAARPAGRRLGTARRKFLCLFRVLSVSSPAAATL